MAFVMKVTTMIIGIAARSRLIRKVFIRSAFRMSESGAE
jgi:hypothetical protein